MNIQDISSKLHSIIREAGKIVICAADTERAFDSKEGNANFVTKYDVAVQNFLIERIKELVPDAVFMAEEKENDEDVLNKEYCFIIDPIDGTTNFIHDYKHSSISVAMLSFGKTVIGAVYDPYLDELFCATSGGGAYLNGRPISDSNNPMELAVVEVGSCPYYTEKYAHKTFSLLHDMFFVTSDFRRSGSAALDLAYLACGRCDIFFEFLLSPWDFAAGQLIVSEAGGVVTRADGYATTLSEKCPVFASNGVLHDEFLKMTKKYI